ncbi:MAG: hypothetical protein ACLQDM_31580 [Bradyrhizobium sp.]
MLRTGIAVAATTLILAGTAFAQQPAASPPPPPDVSKAEIKTTDLGRHFENSSAGAERR